MSYYDGVELRREEAGDQARGVAARGQIGGQDHSVGRAIAAAGGQRLLGGEGGEVDFPGLGAGDD